MQKIILTKETMGSIIGKMKSILKTPFQKFHGYDKNVLRIKNHDLDNIGERADGSSIYGGDVFFSSLVTVHWTYKEPHLYIDNYRKTIEDLPMIHVRLSYDQAACFYHGDVFYFFGGNKVLVDNRNSRHFTKFNEYGFRSTFDIFIRRNDCNTPKGEENWKRFLEMEERLCKQQEEELFQELIESTFR